MRIGLMGGSRGVWGSRLGHWRRARIHLLWHASSQAFALRFGCQHVVWEAQGDGACGIQARHLLRAQCDVRCPQVFRELLCGPSSEDRYDTAGCHPG